VIVRVRTGYGDGDWEDVEGVRFGDYLAVHEAIDRDQDDAHPEDDSHPGWTLTHLPTGLCVTTQKIKQRVYEVAIRVLDADWNFTEKGKCPDELAKLVKRAVADTGVVACY